ncbi:MAG: antibiotic biosynthesis monooxygenase [Candidatus Sulfotelmatobacter sp.]
MFVLLVGLKVKTGQEQTLASDFAGPFSTAISAQEGFHHVSLLRPNDGGDYVMTIAFESQPLQQKWVATELHGQVWPLMEGHLIEFTVKTYTTV